MRAWSFSFCVSVSDHSMFRNPFRYKELILTVVAMSVIAGCDSAPGTPDLSERPPVLQNLAVTPGSIAAVAGAETTVDLTVSWTAQDADGDIDRIFVVVQSPDRGQAALGTADKEIGPGAGQATVQVTFPAGSVGPHPVVVSASDARGRVSNMLLGSVDVVGGSAPPVISALEVPERIVRPAAGEPPATLPLVAVVEDPDGLANVDRVEMQVNGATTLLMCDDGGQGSCNNGSISGDQTAGDGRFTVTIQLGSTNAPGVYAFAFKAIDKSGLESQVITRNIIVE